jgi:glycine/D-amino acid oxidase-like deaminating enzyme
MNSKTYDIIIVGGGIIGGSTAYNLVNCDNKLKVAVVEMDPTYSLSSTTLSVSNARVQFSLTENIQVSQYALDALERFEDEMAVDDNSGGLQKKSNSIILFMSRLALSEVHSGPKTVILTPMQF